MGKPSSVRESGPLLVSLVPTRVRRVGRGRQADPPRGTGDPGLPADELERRLAHYAARAAKRLPLFARGGRRQRDRESRECFGCGVTPSRQTHLRKVGWLVRPFPPGGCSAREVYCPECRGDAP